MKIKDKLQLSWELNNIAEVNSAVARQIKYTLRDFPDGNLLAQMDIMGNTFFHFEKSGCKTQVPVAKVTIVHNMETGKFSTDMEVLQFE